MELSDIDKGYLRKFWTGEIDIDYINIDPIDWTRYENITMADLRKQDEERNTIDIDHEVVTDEPKLLEP